MIDNQLTTSEVVETDEVAYITEYRTDIMESRASYLIHGVSAGSVGGSMSPAISVIVV